MAFERLEAFARGRVPDLDGAIRRCRGEALVVVREGDRRDLVAMAFERLEAGSPIILHSRLGGNSFWLFLLE